MILRFSRDLSWGHTRIKKGTLPASKQGGGKPMKYLPALLVVLAFAVLPAQGAIIDVSQPVHVTDQGGYDRNPSVINDGTDYWLFYTKGDNGGVRGEGGYNPDADSYVVYYKTASTIAGLAAATETKLALSESARPTNFSQRVVSATYFDGDIYSFVSSGQDGTDRGLYYYVFDGSSWSGPTTLIADATARGGHVNVTSDANRVYIVWESSDGSSDCYTWDGATLNSKVDISTDNQPKITLFEGTKGVGVLYVVSIQDGTGNIKLYQAATDPNPGFGPHSTPIPGGGFYDPCIFNDGINLYVISAPWVAADRQYLIQVKSVGTSTVWSTPKTICYGGHSGSEWWDYWPCGYHDGSSAYVFFTTETDNGPYFSDGEIAYIEMDWDLSHDHYFYIKNAAAQAVSGDEVHVSDDLYTESNILIPNGITIEGESRTGVVLSPQGEDDNELSTFGGICQNGFIIGSDNATIKNLTINGEANPDLTAGKNNFRIGVITESGASYSNTRVEDVTIEHMYYRGIYLSITGTGGFITGCSLNDIEAAVYYAYGILVLGDVEITDNTASNIGGRAIGHAYGSALIDGNTVTTAMTGIFEHDWGYSTSTVTITGNSVSDAFTGMNLVGLTQTSVVGGPLMADRNTIDLSATKSGSSAGPDMISRIDMELADVPRESGGQSNLPNRSSIDLGLLIWWADSSATIQNNAITVSEADAGIWIFHLEQPDYPMLFTGNIITATSSDGTNIGEGTGIFMTDDGTFFGDENGQTYATFENNYISGFARGIDLYRNAASPIEGRNVDAAIDGNNVAGNGVGILTNGGAILSFSNNFVTNNTTDGVQISTGLITPPIAELFNNDFSGNGSLAVNNTTGTILNASGNWWGSNDAIVVPSLMSSDLDYTPWLGSGDDTDSDPDNGFQGNFSELWVDDSSPQTGSDERIAEGIDLVEGSTINIAAGTYAESIVFESGFDKDGLSITGDEMSLPVIENGVRFLHSATIDGLTLENLYIKGLAGGANATFDMDNSGAVNDFTMDNCVLDGENVSGRIGFGGQNLSQTLSITNCELKNVLGWAVMDIESGSGDGGSNLPFTTVTFASNHVHHCNGSVALRGSASDRTDLVNVYGNTCNDIGGNEGEQGQHWAAIEVNHADQLNFHENDIDHVSEGEWTEGQAIQIWDIGTIDMYDNNLTNCHQGLYYFGGSAGGTYGGPYAVPAGSIYDNNISGNTQYGISVEATATGGPLDAECNWWGSITGPYHDPSNLLGLGNSVSDNVDYENWSNEALTLCTFSTTPDTVWVDDGYYDGGTNDSHFWGYDAFDNIQEGVDHVAPSGVVIVYTGRYAEQVVIAKSLSLEGNDNPVIEPPSGGLAAYKYEEAGGLTFYPMLFAYGGMDNGIDSISGTGTIDVTITGFDFDGNNTASASHFVGILLRNCVTSEVTYNSLYELLMGSGNPQTGGIRVGGNSDVLIDNNTVDNWTRAGIAAIGDGGGLADPVVIVSNNTVIGRGPMPDGEWAQNGIQISDGAGGNITGNEIYDIAYVPTSWAASAINIYMASSGVIINGNNVHNSEAALYLTYTSDVTISGGNTFDQNEFIMFLGGDNILFEENTLTNSDMGVYIGDATNVDVLNNGFSGNDYAILADGIAANLTFTGNNITSSASCGVYLDEYYGDEPTGVVFYENNISGNAYGVYNLTSVLTDASANWWGDASGPTTGTKSNVVQAYRPISVYAWGGAIQDRVGKMVSPEKPKADMGSDDRGTGDAVSTNVDYTPWLASGSDISGDPGFQGDFSELWVDDDSPQSGSMAIVQEGINLADGSTVNVAAGTYVENVLIDKSLSLIGENGAEIVPGSGSGIDITASDVTVQNLAIHSCQLGIDVWLPQAEYDLSLGYTNLHLLDNTIYDIDNGAWGFGVYVGTESERYNPAHGMYDPDLTDLLDFTGLQIDGNEIYNTTGASMLLQSMRSFDANPLEITGNNIHDNDMSAIWIDGAWDLLIDGNQLVDNSNGIFISNYGDGYYEMTPNVAYDPKNLEVINNTITGNSSVGINLYDGYPAEMEYHTNSIVGNGTGFDNHLGQQTDADCNWWGDNSGPYNATINPLGLGDTASDDVVFEPWNDVTLANCVFTLERDTAWVDDNWTELFCGGHVWGYDAFAVIQEAVDAVSSDGVVIVHAGNYLEQVVIGKQISLEGDDKNTVIIQSPTNLTAYFEVTSKRYPVVYIHDAENVAVSGVTVDGDHQGDNNADFIGLAFWNAGGSFSEAKVLNIMNSVFSGAQHGVGVYAYNNTGGPYTVTLNDVLVDEFQKTAIALNGAGLTVDLDNVTTIGEGPTDVTAQNGIQIGPGVTGNADNCSISLVDWTGPTWTASGLLVFGEIFTNNVDIDQCQTSVYFQDGNGIYNGGIITNPTSEGIIVYSTGPKAGDNPRRKPQPYDDLPISDKRAAIDVTISNSEIMGASVADTYGFYAYAAGPIICTVTSCKFSDWTYAVVSGDGGGGIFSSVNGNSFVGCDYGVGTNAANLQDASANWYAVTDPTAVAALVDGYLDYTPWLGNGTDIEPGTPGFQGDFSVLYVDDDSPQYGSTRRIQEGIDLTDDGSKGGFVYVIDGHYYESVNFSGKDIILASLFELDDDKDHIVNTVIDANPDSLDTDDGSAVNFINGEGSSSALMGFTLCNGTGTKNPSDNNRLTGGAIYCNGSSPTISSCVSHGNSAVRGGAVGLVGSNAFIENCTFAMNDALSGSGISCDESSIPTIDNTIIAFNTEGAAIECIDGGSQPAISCTDIYFNEGGDWTGCVADMDTLYDNLHKDPQFCDTAAADFSINLGSPCNLPAGDCGDLIGALDIGCDFSFYICGDANDDGDVNVSDAVYIINYIFTGGPAPDPLASAEVNCDGDVNVSDAVWIINYIFTGGNEPCDTDGDGIPDC
jgi:nitrous oxidase accessory protein NosD